MTNGDLMYTWAQFIITYVQWRKWVAGVLPEVDGVRLLALNQGLYEALALEGRDRIQLLNAQKAMDAYIALELIGVDPGLDVFEYVNRAIAAH